MRHLDPTQWATAIKQGNVRELARLCRGLDDELEEAQTALLALLRGPRKGHVIGITGVPGAGKSTLINAIISDYRRQNKRVGVIAVDPTSPFSGGAILGDRIRLHDHAADPEVFVRSLATRGAMGGLTHSVEKTIRALDGAGYDPILVETVGVGQDEVDVARTADTTLVVAVPGLGDDIQAIKAGILEIADILVLNKADRPGVNKTSSELMAMRELEHNPATSQWRVPIVQTVATQSQGIAELVAKIREHRHYLESTTDGLARQQTRLEICFKQAFERQLVQTARAVMGPEWDKALAQVLAQQVEPEVMAARLASSLFAS